MLDKQAKKEARLSVKINGVERAIQKSNSFPWILPEKNKEQEKVIHLDEKRKKKVPKVAEEMGELLQVNKKKKKKKEGILFVLFAVMIGVGFGFGLLNMIQPSTEQAGASVEETANQENVSATLEALEVHVLQNGVFSDRAGAEKLEEELLKKGTPAAIIEEDKAYVFSGIANTEESINKLKVEGVTYKKTFTIPAMEMKSSEQESGKIILIRDIIGKMLQIGETSSEKEWTELGNQIKALQKLESSKGDKELYEATLASYETITAQHGKVNKETQQALLNIFSNYQKFIFAAKK